MTLALATRLDRWQAPTGRWLTEGDTFQVRGKRGRWRFLAFVDAEAEPYVEAVKVGGNGVRCVRPELVHGVRQAGES